MKSRAAGEEMDIIFKSLTKIFAKGVLDFYDINTAPIVRAKLVIN